MNTSFENQDFHPEEEEDIREAKLKPWLSIWVHPRKTIRYLLATDFDRGVWLLLSIRGIERSVSNLIGKGSVYDSLSFFKQMSLAVFWGTLSGVFFGYLYAKLLSVAGRWLGGEAEPAETRAVVAWASVPLMVSLLVLLLLTTLSGFAIFAKNSPESLSTGQDLPGFLTLFSYGIFNGLLNLWSFLIMLAGIAEVHKFSLLKSLLTLLLAAIPLALLILLLALLI